MELDWLLDLPDGENALDLLGARELLIAKQVQACEAGQANVGMMHSGPT